MGIGKAKATRLWKNFGSDLYEILGRGGLEKLSYVLPEETAQRLVEAWQVVVEEAGIISFLDAHGSAPAWLIRFARCGAGKR